MSSAYGDWISECSECGGEAARVDRKTLFGPQGGPICLDCWRLSRCPHGVRMPEAFLCAGCLEEDEK